MRIAVVGAGAAGIFYALMRKKYHPEDEIFLLDQESQIGKKIYATGNGRCNLGNVNEMHDDTYRHFSSTKKCLENATWDDIWKEMQWLGLEIKTNEHGLIYPRTESAKTVMDVFLYRLKQMNIMVYPSMEMTDYAFDNSKWKVCTKKENMFPCFDRLVFATGGKSSPKLGSKGTMYPIFHEHGYSIHALCPGLTPLQVEEDVSALSGIRIKCRLSLLEEQKVLYQEGGEVLFKKDGISGIAVMNASSIYQRRGQTPTVISLDLFPEYSVSELVSMWEQKEENGYPYLDGTILTPLARYIEKRAKVKGRKSKQEKEVVAKLVKSLTFKIVDSYSFQDSQVTIGGVSLQNIDDYFESKKETGVYFIGEVLDQDGLCGGWNLMWAWLSAFIAAKEK